MPFASIPRLQRALALLVVSSVIVCARQPLPRSYTNGAPQAAAPGATASGSLLSGKTTLIAGGVAAVVVVGIIVAVKHRHKKPAPASRRTPTSSDPRRHGNALSPTY